MAQGILTVGALIGAAQFAVFMGVLAWFVAGSLKGRRTSSHD